MKTEDRKAAIAAYKKRTAIAGIYALRCAATGEVWVGRAPDLDTVWRRLSFTLTHGASLHASLQAAWRAHGCESFSFEALESIEEEIDYVRDRRLKQRLDHWCAALGARVV